MWMVWKRLVTEDLGIKVASLVLALAVYVHVFSTGDRVSTFPVPLQIVGLPQDLVYEGAVPGHVDVRIAGTGTELWKLRTHPIVAEIDLRDARPGHLQRPITISDVLLPVGADVRTISLESPKVLSLQIDRKVQRTVPVAVRLVGALDPGITLSGRPKATPATLRVTGGEHQLSTLDSLRTEGIALGGRSHELRTSVRIEVPRGTVLERDSVIVEVPIERRERRSMGPVRVAVSGPFARAWVASPESVRVVLQGPASLLDGVTAAALTARTDTQGGPAPVEDAAVRVRASLGSKHRGIEVVGTDPAEVTLVRKNR